MRVAQRGGGTVTIVGVVTFTFTFTFINVFACAKRAQTGKPVRASAFKRANRVGAFTSPITVVRVGLTLVHIFAALAIPRPAIVTFARVAAGVVSAKRVRVARVQIVGTFVDVFASHQLSCPNIF
jgi:hypothetical protein